MRVLVTGGTGELGSAIVTAALGAGHVLRIASRRARSARDADSSEWAQMDLETNAGIDAALDGVDAVVHAASDPRRPEAVDIDGTRSLAAASKKAGVRHLIYVSIVGIEAIPVKYYRAKLAAEEVVATSGVPWSILRATQFHSFIDRILRALARCPIVLPVPAGFCVQSVATSEVAARLLRCVLTGPAGRLPDFGGPEVLSLADAAGEWMRLRGVHKPLLQVPIPGGVAAAFRAGKNTVREGEHGRITWSEWLRTQSS